MAAPALKGLILHQSNGFARHGDANGPPPRPIDFIQDRDELRSRLPEGRLKIDHFELIRTLGTGTFARVWLVRLKNRDRGDDTVFALKVLRKADVVDLKQVEHVRNENRALRAASDFPLITTLVAAFSDEECLYMLLEYCPGGELFSYLRRMRRFDEHKARFYAAEIVLTLEYLHEIKGVAYRDLKPENILMDSHGHLKLVDFGFAKQLYDRETYTLCGTPEYLAPEVIRNSGHGLAVDWWALGILIYEFLVGQPPFWDPNPLRIYEKILEGNVVFPAHVSPAARDLISSLCKVSPSERLGHIAGGVHRIKSHRFFRGINWEALSDRRQDGPVIPRIDSRADTGNFEVYPPPLETTKKYTPEMRLKYEDSFKEFDD